MNYCRVMIHTQIHPDGAQTVGCLCETGPEGSTVCVSYLSASAWHKTEYGNERAYTLQQWRYFSPIPDTLIYRDEKQLEWRPATISEDGSRKKSRMGNKWKETPRFLLSSFYICPPLPTLKNDHVSSSFFSLGISSLCKIGTYSPTPPCEGDGRRGGHGSVSYDSKQIMVFFLLFFPWIIYDSINWKCTSLTHILYMQFCIQHPLQPQQLPSLVSSHTRRARYW